MSTKKILCTGSRGFIGTHLVQELEKRGHEVIECDPKIDEKSDIRNLSPDTLTGVDWLFHMGAASGSLHFQPDPISGVDANCTGTTILLEAAKQAGVKKVIFSSTGSSYGGTALPHNEDWPLKCPNFYTATKIFDEQSMKLYSELYGLDTVILRYASVYGTNEESKILPIGNLANVLSQFIWKMMKGEQPELWGTGKQTRDFVFVDDIVGANIFAAENLGSGQVYNVGTGTETTFLALVKTINSVLGTELEAKIVEPENRSVQKQYVDRQQFDIDKLAQAGWKYSITVETGIKKIVENIKAREKSD